MRYRTATGIACANIALIKYWGNRDDALRIPANGSLSMNLAGLETQTSVSFDTGLKTDTLKINNEPASEPARLRVSQVLDIVRRMAGLQAFATVESRSNFPVGAGLASSASAFAALALAAAKAAGLTLREPELSRLARHGSGSACRSVPGGFVEWLPGTSDADSYAVSLAPADHWDLVDCIAIVNPAHKATDSSKGNTLASTSPLQPARVQDTPRRLDICRRAILDQDFQALAGIVELDSNMLHAIMMTSSPALYYWEPATLAIMQAVREARLGGLPACSTIDAGPNVHVIAPKSSSMAVEKLLQEIEGVQEVCVAGVGDAARIVQVC